MCQSRSVNDAGPLDFSGVYRRLWERQLKRALVFVRIQEERDGFYAIYYF